MILELIFLFLLCFNTKVDAFLEFSKRELQFLNGEVLDKFTVRFNVSLAGRCAVYFEAENHYFDKCTLDFNNTNANFPQEIQVVPLPFAKELSADISIPVKVKTYCNFFSNIHNSSYEIISRRSKRGSGGSLVTGSNVIAPSELILVQYKIIGVYQLVKSSFLTIQAQHKLINNNASVIDKLAVRYGNDVFVIDSTVSDKQKAVQVITSFTRVTVSYTSTNEFQSLLIYLACGTQIVVNFYSSGQLSFLHVDLRLATYLYPEVRGLIGNLAVDPSRRFQLTDGTVVSIDDLNNNPLAQQRFFESWRVPSSDLIFTCSICNENIRNAINFLPGRCVIPPVPLMPPAPTATVTTNITSIITSTSVSTSLTTLTNTAVITTTTTLTSTAISTSTATSTSITTSTSVTTSTATALTTSVITSTAIVNLTSTFSFTSFLVSTSLVTSTITNSLNQTSTVTSTASSTLTSIITSTLTTTSTATSTLTLTTTSPTTIATSTLPSTFPSAGSLPNTFPSSGPLPNTFPSAGALPNTFPSFTTTGATVSTITSTITSTTVSTISRTFTTTVSVTNTPSIGNIIVIPNVSIQLHLPLGYIPLLSIESYRPFSSQMNVSQPLLPSLTMTSDITELINGCQLKIPQIVGSQVDSSIFVRGCQSDIMKQINPDLTYLMYQLAYSKFASDAVKTLIKDSDFFVASKALEVARNSSFATFKCDASCNICSEQGCLKCYNPLTMESISGVCRRKVRFSYPSNAFTPPSRNITIDPRVLEAIHISSNQSNPLLRSDDSFITKLRAVLSATLDNGLNTTLNDLFKSSSLVTQYTSFTLVILGSLLSLFF
ncbi:hypothetical protein HMI54_007955 [Coelomomyces lativittatus]|nr:hypothetical protein HMI55_001273 [Coelomomyces lativittatus]KAJ1508707.1 hypothetical protein HMI56_007142 [Coelomomyces lativittatus]KAJ1516850.1 hypothetical protein HMI54_007955 [Coelomomyces lativittatus]